MAESSRPANLVRIYSTILIPYGRQGIVTTVRCSGFRTGTAVVPRNTGGTRRRAQDGVLALIHEIRVRGRDAIPPIFRVPVGTEDRAVRAPSPIGGPGGRYVPFGRPLIYTACLVGTTMSSSSWSTTTCVASTLPTSSVPASIVPVLNWLATRAAPVRAS